MIYLSSKTLLFFLVTSSTDSKGPILSALSKANQQRLLSMKNDQQTAVAIRDDRSGYLELIEGSELSIHVNHRSTWILPTVCLGALMMMIIMIWYSKQKTIEVQHQEAENSDYQLPEPVFQSR
jgi:hypothetical protein